MGGSHAVGGWLCLTVVKPWPQSCQASSNSYPKCRQESGFSDWHAGRQAAGSGLVSLLPVLCFLVQC